MNQEIRNLDISRKNITIDSMDGSHLHRHVRVACKILATDDVKRAVTASIKDDRQSHIARLTFYNDSDTKVGEVTTDVGKIVKMYDAAFDHHVRLQLNNITKHVK